MPILGGKTQWNGITSRWSDLLNKKTPETKPKSTQLHVLANFNDAYKWLENSPEPS